MIGQMLNSDKGNKAKEYLTIGLYGAVLNSGNLGCVALTYSLLFMLEKISENLKIKFRYTIFEILVDECKKNLACEKLGIDKDRVKDIRGNRLGKALSILHHVDQAANEIKEIRKCDLIIDLTAGDSFTDIYGQWRFDSRTNTKLIIEKMNKPIILGPQTYGPFTEEKNRKKAVRAIDRAQLVIARDNLSIEYLKEIGINRQDIYSTTDLAFSLPFSNENEIKRLGNTDKIRVGINISGLLIKNKNESTTLQNHLATDYEAYIEDVLEYLHSNDKYEVYVIPHVGEDGGNQFRDKFKEFHYLNQFPDPISAKNFISCMDIFLGSRMHATIAAFSSGVATIPIAYSRKFKGVFDVYEYPYVIDLENENNETNIDKTIEFINGYQKLKELVENKIIDILELEIKTNTMISTFIATVKCHE